MFKLPDLPYAYDALEPYIDEATMRVHHLGHHQGYTNKLNAAIEGTCYENKSIDEILKSIHIHQTAIRNNGGGYWNHNLYWRIMKPGGSEPGGKIAAAIRRDFGSFENFRDAFKQAGLSRFGSGWTWLVSEHGKLHICTTPNQDNPLMKFVDCLGKPVLGMDVWEHAYYLKHQNKRGAYIDDFFHVINWDEVNRLYEESLDK